MSDIIDFKTEKTKKQTDPNLVMTAPDGSTWFKYSALYDYECEQGFGMPLELHEALIANGSTFVSKRYAIDFWAQSEEEARTRVEAIKKSLEYGYQLSSEIPA